MKKTRQQVSFFTGPSRRVFPPIGRSVSGACRSSRRIRPPLPARRRSRQPFAVSICAMGWCVQPGIPAHLERRGGRGGGEKSGPRSPYCGKASRVRAPAASGHRCCRFRSPLEPEGDLDRLFAVGGHGGAGVANLGEMDDPEIDLRLDGPRAGSRSVTFGDVVRIRSNPLMVNTFPSHTHM